jgi:hypothetical protein
MGLRLLKCNVGAQFPQTSHKCFADLLIHGEDAFLSGYHYDAVGDFIGVEDRPTSCWPADDIDPIPVTFFDVDLFNALVPAK